jgi:sigma-B regulation protein RsbU (phosphoserine phosphatase)
VHTNAPRESHTMQCLEVWGGNQAVDNGVVMPGLDAWVFSRPFGEGGAGGDIHYVSSCASGRITRVLVADVSGHGASVAGIAVKLRALMRRYVNFIDQTRLVEGLNREFAALGNEGGEFATAVVVTFWAPTDHLVVSNAGHPRPLWYRARERRWRALASDAAGRGEGISNIPLGIAEPTRYDVSKIRLDRGDLVVLYTDSLIEARDAAGRHFGEEGLLDLARSLDVERPAELISGLLAGVRAHAAGAPEGDDVTVLVLRPNEWKPRVGLREGTRAAMRVTADWLSSLARGGFARPEIGVASLLGAFIPRFNRRVGDEAARGDSEPSR